jgi:hypothetical protein
MADGTAAEEEQDEGVLALGVVDAVNGAVETGGLSFAAAAFRASRASRD